MLRKQRTQFIFNIAILAFLVVLGTGLFPILNGNPQPAINAQADNNHVVSRLPADRLKWKFKTGGMIASSPVVANGMVYFGSVDKRLYVVDKISGQVKWRFVAHSIIWSSPTIAAGTIYFGSDDGHLYALNSKTGKEKWRFRTGRFPL